MNEWKPIASAPKDGTKILIYTTCTDDILQCWWNGNTWESVEAYIPFPTHWMPKIAPPIKKHHCASELNLYECKSRPDGKLQVRYLAHHFLNEYAYIVSYCPICGEKACT